MNKAEQTEKIKEMVDKAFKKQVEKLNMNKIESMKDIKTNDLVGFYSAIKDDYGEGHGHKEGIVSANDDKRGIVVIKWFGSPGYMKFKRWNTSIIRYENLEKLDFVKIGVSKYETIYKPAFFGILGVYGFWHFFGAFITGIAQISALGFGGATAFIVAKNFKRIIKSFQIKKNVTVLNPIQKDASTEAMFDDEYKIESNGIKRLNIKGAG